MINFKVINPLFSLNSLIKFTSQNFFLPFYHTVSDYRLPHISNLYQLRNRKQFEQDLDYLCRYFEPVSMFELEGIIRKNKIIGKPVFHLTFDDGLKECYTEILPILEKKGIPATFFVNTDFVDNKAFFYRYKVSLLIEKINADGVSRKQISDYFGVNENNLNELKNRLLAFRITDEPEIDKIAILLECDFDEYLDIHQPYMSKNQVETLINRGYTIGSHSLNHPFFKYIDFDEQKRQVIESFNYLEKEFGIKDFYFSFPFSDESVDCKFINWLYADANCRLSFGISGLKHDCTKFHLHRIPFEKNSDNVRDIIKNEYLYYILKSLFHKNTINRK